MPLNLPLNNNDDIYIYIYSVKVISEVNLFNSVDIIMRIIFSR